jgi:class 3 adenylate cyclase
MKASTPPLHKPPAEQGAIAIVYTNIEGFSALMEQHPAAAAVALTAHTAALRTAAWANAGFVLEQEGDSFLIAFYDQMDAVDFCMQAWCSCAPQGAPSPKCSRRLSLVVRPRRDANSSSLPHCCFLNLMHTQNDRLSWR